MGILNVTPDSFSDGGLYATPEAAVERGLALAAEGADVIDVGGESTRPDSVPVPVDEELRRTIPVIEALAARVRIPLSIDTSKAEVARQALRAGASLVNDVTALREDPEMARVVASHGARVILMHMQGTPQTMQRRPRYGHVVRDVTAFLRQAAEQARRAGIARSRILVDPGLGFGKTIAHNLALLRHVDQVVALGYPVVIGPSRKSFIGRVLAAEVSDRLVGTLACVGYAIRGGVRMVRVHDVKPARQFLDMWQAIEDETPRLANAAALAAAR